MARKKARLSFYKFVDLCTYYGFSKQRAYINGRLYNGYLYRTDKLSASTLQALKNYSNVIVFNIRAQYAPEHISVGIFIAHSLSKAQNAKALNVA